MQIGIPKESLKGENRVAATPSSVKALVARGFEVKLEKLAGKKASFNDSDYLDNGAVTDKKEQVWQSDIIFKVNPPTEEEVELMKDGATLVSFIQPAQNAELVALLHKRNITTLAMDMVPRLTRSQSLDALSSMANIAGYRAVVEASHHFGRFFTGQITAAGNLPPAKVLVIGAGVAGLAAIGAAGSLGAVVRAFDTRPEVKEQIESMGAEFLELDYEEDEQAGSGDGYAKEMSKAFIDAEMALFAEQAKDVDIIITTAMIPGKPAPKLITAEMVESMKPGSVIVDLAAAGGGNCELTKPEKLSTIKGVKIIGYTDLVSRLPNQSSQLYANNLVNLTKLICPAKDGEITIDFDDQVIRNMTVVHQGEITFPPPPIQVSAAPTQPKQTLASKLEVDESKVAKPEKTRTKYVSMAIGGMLFAWLASVAPSDFLSHFTVFILSCVVGYHVVWNVSHSLHTPLMSVTNAISGIIIVGALLQVGSDIPIVQVLAGIAILIATINIVGGFFVTKRMLKMFRK
ncbi:Re/Si-specific NAD(P)(+) transhydrogenase subunit alpha [Thalassotalea sp. M1531]|uniref:NAD(P) transhydrogenase subunit alpha n=1 Tax=Thalassotalea algicola TaxID=2716224 RepID=A0A7Y0LFV0_9GAMM|nr:Re/Si-specific NAD(P)(+) transhydrogenase subunit alpha [Thalassotalea algicola]NMP33472.1 Re/Si-specific NAD(P)(+) transhydrogenase subunit alpha [Thalassotalea algicola]